MGQKHKEKIKKIFEHPISGNIDVHRVISALEHYGVKIEMTKHHRAKMFFKNEELILALSHRNEMSKDNVARLRHFLEKVDLVPDKL